MGTEIRCWACREPIVVPMPRARLHVGRTFGEAFAEATQGPDLLRILAAAAIVTAGFCIPGVGLVVGGVFLLLVASFHGFEIRRASERGEDPAPKAPGRGRVAVAALRGLLGSALAAGLAVPLWARHAGYRKPPHLDRSGLIVLLVTLALLPVAGLLANGNGSRGGLGSRKALRLAFRFPFAAMAAVLIVPATLFFLEIGLASLFYIQGTFGFFTIEFMPWPEKPLVIDGVPYLNLIDFRNYPMSSFIPTYLKGLRQGYSFVGSFPASLSIASRIGLSGHALYVNDAIYAGIRVFVTAIILTVVLAAGSIQARWLGAISGFEKWRPA